MCRKLCSGETGTVDDVDCRTEDFTTILVVCHRILDFSWSVPLITCVQSLVLRLGQLLRKSLRRRPGRDHMRGRNRNPGFGSTVLRVVIACEINGQCFLSR